MAAPTNTKSKQQQPPPAAATTPVDPKFEWTEKAGSYVLRLALPGFRKDDFRVQVDGAGRLTVRGSRPAPTGPGSLHKVFQLPAAASLDDIAGRLEAGVLTLTVPKRASAGGDAGAVPTSVEEIRREQPGVAMEEGATGGAKKGDAGAKKAEAKEDASKKSMDKAQEKKQEEVEEAKSREQEQQKPAPSPAPVKKEEEVKPKAPHAAPAQKQAPKPEGATRSDKAQAAVSPDSLAERVKRRGEEERAKVAAAATAAMKAISEPEKKATASWGGGWKERVQGELKVLTDMKWADGLVEAARNNKEVVAVGVAAFSLGFLVSQKLLRK